MKYREAVRDFMDTCRFVAHNEKWPAPEDGLQCNIDTLQVLGPDSKTESKEEKK